ncbi:NADH-ubiquinone oxidoreductase-F iron-sulfur binding region domain-containing protein [Nocardioides sp.]|uniref:NADH-ubiquinone oxidoreductase-F iron-sulfur binding region domain-containing protein n=1 Tax=Nocardioides sp. TaxID=35761 RepID=UPI0035287B14
MNAPTPVPIPTELSIHPGPALLSGIDAGSSLATHRAQYGDLPAVSLPALLESVDSLRMRGRGGAAFPFAIKLRTASQGRRPVVVVNMSEGEPASAKDSALAMTRPHLVLDGAVATARALRASTVHVILPGDRPGVVEAMQDALAERRDKVRFQTHQADPVFVAGQARAVLELMAGRPNLPVTAWAPEAISGHKGRPTLLSNAETWAQVGRLVLVDEGHYRRFGTDTEPGTTLMTFTGDGVPQVKEVEFGTRIRDVLPPGFAGRPALVGGFHGAWAPWHTLASARVSVDGMKSLSIPLGAGVVVSPPQCPVTFTSRVVDYLAGQSARRCGPCLNGLPALAEALRAVSSGRGGTARVEELAGVVVRRGACAHPDGTVRLVRSLLATFPGEVAAHAEGTGCGPALEEAS